MPLLIVAMLCAATLGAAEPGDRGCPRRTVYPEAAFIERGGPVIDVTRPPFSAVGDGRTDDTAAFVRVMDVLRDRVAAIGHMDDRLRHVLYLPAGTYLVSDTLTHGGERVEEPGVGGDLARVRIVGEDRRTTTIRLEDASPGFGAGAAKPVLTLVKDHRRGSNVAFANEVSNLTIDVGADNPRAVALAYVASNIGAVDRVTCARRPAAARSASWRRATPPRATSATSPSRASTSASAASGAPAATPSSSTSTCAASARRRSG